FDTFFIRVATPPSAGTITGTQTVCKNATTTLANTTTGGIWSSSDIAIASVNTTGLVTGVNAGSAIISYGVTNICGTTYDTALVTVKPLPDSGIISGTPSACVGGTTALSETVSGGVWSSANAARASISTSGVVFGRTSGTVVISYTVTNTCGSATDTMLVTISPATSAGTITGTQVVCEGATTTLSDATTGGVWSSSNTGVASVSTSGVVSGLTGGTSIISYTVTNGCGTATDTALVTVNPLPVPATVTGANELCLGNNTTLTNSTGGGTWSSTNPAVATVSNTGVVTSVAIGVATISYTITNTCGSVADTQLINVTTVPTVDPITGAIICQAATTTLTSATPGGTWTTSAATIATVSSTGVVTGVAAGSAVVTYTVTNSCGSSNDTALITVNPLAQPGAITGPTSVCTGSSIALSDTATGGTWNSSDNTIATVTASGIVTGVSSGSVTISYTKTNSCGSVAATWAVTVNGTPSAGTISGPASVCLGSSITLSSTVTGGTWSATNSNASVVATTGLVGGLAGGLDTILYTVTTSCGTGISSYTVNVGAPTSAGTISGPGNVCVGSNISLTSSVFGGSWSSSNTTLASVNSSTGVVYGRASGTVIITYLISSTCGAALDTALVNVLPVVTAGTITGPTTVCTGGNISLSNTTSGGAWSSADASIATVNTTGTVTGVASGTTIISYTVANACSSATDTATVVVTGPTGAGLINGPRTVCTGTSASLTETLSGGSWSSSNAAVATVSATGSVFGAAAGNAVISYTATTACGTTIDTFALNILAAPVADTIAGPANVCTGAFVTFSNSVAGGTWTTGNAAIATVDGVGNVIGVATGTTNITYTINNACGTSQVSKGITVSLPADAGTISGTTTLCVGGSSTLTSSVAGGTWSSGNAPVASISSAGGVLTGMRAGFAIITYSVATGCGTAFATTLVTIQNGNAGAITGPANVCIGSSITLADTVSGGTWSTANPTVVTVSNTGVVTGLTSGSALISYSVTNACGTTAATYVVTVSPAPDAGTITGGGSLCAGATLALSETATGGAWSTGNASIASVNSAGVVTGIGTGTTLISYTVASACSTAVATTSVTVGSSTGAGTLSGGPNVCVGSSVTYTPTVSGGTWSTSDAAVASVSSTGVVTGIATGSATITYTVIASCGAVTATAPVNVGAAPDAGALTGPSTVCVGATGVITPSVGGGTWSVSSASLATVNVSGVLTGLSAGSVVVSYSVSTACSTAVATLPVTIAPITSPGTLTGPAGVCVGSSVVFNPSVAGGTWSTANAAVASVDGFGIVTGVATGSTTISYSFTGTCGTVSATAPVSVSNPPASATISGADTICRGASTTLTPSVSGGTWSSGTPAIATVTSAGVVTGLTSGTVVISYSLATACSTSVATKTMVINPLADAGAITGPSIVCVGGSATLADAIAGGTWTSSNTAVATISATGDVTGLTVGTTTISYSVTNSCGTGTTTFTFTVGTTPVAGTISGSTAICYTVTTACGTATAVQPVSISAFPNAGVILGPTNLCIGSSVAYTDTIPGGVWSSGDTTIATVNASGVVTGRSAGTVNIYYSVTNACGATNVTISLHVSASPGAGTLSGSTTVCPGGSSALSASMTGGVWSTTDASIASISTSGVLTGVATGSATISYGVASTCGMAYTSVPVTVRPTTDPGTITGPASLCAGASTTLTETVSGGSWTTSNAAIASVSSTGVLTGVSAGSVTITYTATGICGTATTTYTTTITPATNAGTITGTNAICLGSATFLSDSVTGGTWSTSNASVASVSTSGVVTGLATGSATISYTVTGACGAASATMPFTVSTTPNEGLITGATSICQAASTALAETVTGGTWSSGDPTIATVTSTGVVTGVSSGTVLISYSVTNACGIAVATAFMTVNPLADPGTISGPATLCIPATGTYTSTVAGGTWSVAPASVATISSAGVVTPLSNGVAVVAYSATNTCGTVTATDTIVVNTAPTTAGTLSGATSACPGTTTTLSTTVSGGTWSVADTAVATVSSTGVVTAIAAGTTTVAYTISNACGTASASTPFTVNPGAYPGTITAPSTLLCTGSTIAFTDSVAGGTWSSADTSIAIVSTTGMVTALTAGTTTISYTISNSCGTGTATVNVNVVAAPTVAAIAGPTVICAGTTATLTNATIGGSWATSDATIASIDPSTGAISGVSAGVVTVSYSITSSFGCVATTSRIDTVLPAPAAGSITAATTSLCAGTSLSLSDTAIGGTWSSADATIATVDASGMVTGLTSGTVAISYSVTNSCGTAVATTTLNVLPAPVMSAISGASSICEGASVTYTNSYFGGTWSSTNTAVVSINSTTGAATAIAAGMATISYTATNVLGCTTTVTLMDTVRPVPHTGTISAPAGTTLCAGNTLSLTDAATGGVWSSSNTAVASVDATGTVYGIAGGTADISYSVTNSCGTDVATAAVTVNPQPAIGTIGGTSPMCTGNTQLLTNSAFGGVWTSADATVATVNSTTGDLTALAAGTTTITYTVTNVFGCQSVATFALTVHPSADAGTISASTTTICAGNTLALSETATGGTWSSSDVTVATVDTLGMVTAVNSGTATISYTATNSFGCTTHATAGLTVNPSPVVAAIGGATSMCTGSSLVVTNTTLGGVWSSSNPAVASVDLIGNVSGVAAGTSAISYTVTNVFGCSITATLPDTVTDAPVLSAIGGPATLCTGTPATLTNSATGGTWTSGNTLVATIDPVSGVINGLTTGTAVISYEVHASAGCSTITLTTVTVNIAPTVAATTGTTSVCAGGTTTLSNTTPLGVWSSSNATITSVSTAGVVTGLSAGTDTVYYTVTNASGCTAVAATEFTVHPLPAISGIAGGPNACLGAPVAFTAIGADTTSTGVWSTNDAAIASVDATTGAVTGVALGATTITYTATSSFGCVTTITTGVTVNALPTVASITGATSVCQGSSVTLANSTIGGVWSSADTLIASAAGTGDITGVGAGTVLISYTVTAPTGCSNTATHSLTVNPAPSVSAIIGASAVCLGSTATYTNASTGGTWSVTPAALATISTTGTVTALGAGTATVSYTVSGGFGCTATVTQSVTINSLPVVSAISGPSAVCAGSTIRLADTMAGGVWSSSTSATATVSATGDVTGISAGTAVISYSITDTLGCTGAATQTVTVNAAPATPTLSGASGICTGTTTTLTASVGGGVWSSNDTAIASVTAAGVVNGRSAGLVTISYSVTNASGCTATATRTLTVSDAPTGTMSPTGSLTLCLGTPASLAVTASGATSYQWYKNSTAIAGATNATYLADTAGFYNVGISNGGCTVVVSGITISMPPNPIINRGSGTLLYTGSFTTYQWYLNGVAIPGAIYATYNATSPGRYTVMVTDGNGCSRTSAIYVLEGPNSVVEATAVTEVKWYPNPATSIITIEASAAVKVAIVSPDGKVVMDATESNRIDVSRLATGIYMIVIYDTDNHLLRTDRFMKAE
ncbi:MAG: T9SS C-terminal target domain-containing protein, partial [Chitinophagia bacterium]|nr:T9SS C-terminal target domain-containing protein [Chitinophagia bacterium]